MAVVNYVICAPGPSMGFGIPCGGGILERDQCCSF
jgi:hypothetical protein